MKGGVTLDRHAALWDACSRNGIFLIGTGVSDDHSGKDWLGQQWNFFTWAWAADTSRSALVSALAGGRAYFGDPARFRGQLDMMVDGGAPMGSVTVSTAASRTVRLIVAGLPSGATVELVRGVVDFAGKANPDPVNTTTVLPASDFVIGYADLTLDTARDGAGVVVALTNPVWLLRDVPPGGIPLPRSA